MQCVWASREGLPTKPRFTPNQIEDLTRRIRFSALRVPGHASDNKHTDTNARCSLVFSLNFQTRCLPLCKFANLGITGWFRATWACLKEPEWDFFPPLFSCFPLLTVEQIPTDTISYLKKELWEKVCNSLLKVMFWLFNGCHPLHLNCCPIHWLLLGINCIDCCILYQLCVSF